MITIEVEACLRHLRHKAYIRALWVDAVCIDQQDLMERGSQVEFMRYISRQAAVVHVWLGYRTRQTEELMEDIARAPSSEHYAKNIWDADAKQAHRSLDLEVSLLLSQDWWSRLWIRQEVALAKIVRLHYGKNSAELQQLKHWALTTKTLDCDGDAYVACVYQVNALTTLREIVLLRNRDELVILLAESRESSVADARDRVYGQLGFVSAILQEDIMRTDQYSEHRIGVHKLCLQPHEKLPIAGYPESSFLAIQLHTRTADMGTGLDFSLQLCAREAPACLLY